MMRVCMRLLLMIMSILATLALANCASAPAAPQRMNAPVIDTARTGAQFINVYADW